MKAPDKIYLGIQELDMGYVYNLSLDNNGEQEYVRKEVLFEWAKECFRLQDSGSWYSKGAADAFSKLIDKLNEM